MKPSESRPASPRSATQPEVVASLHAVGRFFDDFRLVHALVAANLEVRRGETFGLLGSKDSGKSTTLKLLAGRLSPSDGKVRVFGRSPRRPKVKRRIGYLPEPLCLRPKRESAGLKGLLRDLFNRLPVRLAAGTVPTSPALLRGTTLAQVLFKSPDLVLLDEPFFGLEPAALRELKTLILDLSRRGKTVILSCDSLLHAKDVCNRLAVYYAGRVQAVGTLPELLAHPEALRFLAPLLPRQTAERMLEVIRSDLSAGPSSAEIPLPEVESSLPAVQQTLPGTDPSVPATAVEKILAPLAKPPAPKPSPESRKPAPATVNHERLAELTKPAPKP